jgi:hypothetical protein
MARKRRTARPSDPQAMARRRADERARQCAIGRDPAQWGVNAAALELTANGEVEMRQGPGRRATRIQRKDIFDRFRDQGSLNQGACDAVRRLQNDIAVLHRTLTGGGDFAPRIDRSIDPQSFADARRRAGARIEAALALTGVASAALLAALCEPDVVLGRGADWRAVVARRTGERLPDAQGAVLRAACENLAGAYAHIDRGRARRR